MGRRISWGLSGELITGQSSSTVSLQTGDLSDIEYKYYTVQFGVTQPAVGTVQAVATITYSVNGVPITRQMSVANGAEISGPADSITVRVVDATSANFGPPGQSYTVSITLCPGTRAATGENSPILIDPNAPVILPKVGTEEFVNVPQGIGVVGFWISGISLGNNINAPQIEVDQNLPASGSFTGRTLSINGVYDSKPLFIPLMPGITQLGLTNEDTTADAQVSILWVIDG